MITNAQKVAEVVCRRTGGFPHCEPLVFFVVFVVIFVDVAVGEMLRCTLACAGALGGLRRVLDVCKSDLWNARNKYRTETKTLEVKTTGYVISNYVIFC